MADQEDAQAPDIEFAPGELAPFDYSPEQQYTADNLTAEEVLAFTDLVEKANRRDLASHRFEIEQAWEARLFDRGYQYLVRGRQGGWYLPQGSKDGNVVKGAYNLKPTNIY